MADDPARRPVDRRPPDGERQRVGVVDLGHLFAGDDLAHKMITSSVSRERTQGRPEGPAPAAPPSLAQCSRGTLRAAIRPRRVLAVGGQAFQLGDVPGHRLGQRAGQGHVLGGDAGRVGHAHRQADVGVITCKIGAASPYTWQ